MFGLFRLVGALDRATIRAWSDRKWLYWIALWLGGTLGLAVFSFLIVLIPADLWEFGSLSYASIIGATTTTKTTYAEFLHYSLLAAAVNGAMVLVCAPLLMIAQELMGDFNRPKTE